MKNQAARDATLLALLAENPSMPPEEFDKLLASIEDPSLREAAQALRSGAPPDLSSDAGQLADSVRSWAERGRKRRETNAARPRLSSPR
jgi:hypothetical protein